MYLRPRCKFYYNPIGIMAANHANARTDARPVCGDRARVKPVDAGKEIVGLTDARTCADLLGTIRAAIS